MKQVQHRSAKFVIDNYNYLTGSITGILEQVKWKLLRKTREDDRCIVTQQEKNNNSIPTDYLAPLQLGAAGIITLASQVPGARTDIYKCNFFLYTDYFRLEYIFRISYFLC